jgi:MFS family permease
MAASHSEAEKYLDVTRVEKTGVDGDGVIVKTAREDTVYANPALSLIQTIRAYPKASFICFIAALSAVSDGYQIQMSGSIIALPGFINQFGFPIGVNGAMKLNPNHVSLFGSKLSLLLCRLQYFSLIPPAAMKTIATAVGGAMGTWPSDRFGRKPMILAIQIILAAGTICEMFATDWSHWVVARTIEGLGNGLNISIIGVYIAELAPTNGRGAMIALYALWFTIGGLLCSVALYIVQALPTELWRRAVYSSWAFTGVACLLWFYLPESPRYYCQKGDEQRAKAVLNRLFAGTKDFNLEAEYAMLVREVNSQHGEGEEVSLSYRSLLKRPNLVSSIVNVSSCLSQC